MLHVLFVSKYPIVPYEVTVVDSAFCCTRNSAGLNLSPLGIMKQRMLTNETVTFVNRVIG